MEYNKSFETTYYYKDYNSSAINFYTNELEKSYKQYISTDNPKSIFDANVKMIISKKCIIYHLKTLNEADYYEVSEKIRKNTRNKVAYNTEIRDRIRSNNHYMNLNNYVYDISMFSDIITDKSNIELCNKELSSAKFYEQVLPLYIERYTKKHSVAKSDAKDLTEAYYVKREEWLKEIR